jgi:hypothetical protein
MQKGARIYDHAALRRSCFKSLKYTITRDIVQRQLAYPDELLDEA